MGAFKPNSCVSPTSDLSPASTETAQLLLIVSDGRGLFLEGKERVTAAVRAARSANIFIIFVALDNPNSRVSEEEEGDALSYVSQKKTCD